MNSKYDDLTGLKLDTRGLELKQTLLDAEQSSQTVGVLYIDLDRLHPWNHKHGHSAGHDLL